MQPLISLILCTHNPQPAYLRRTLESLRRQTLPLDKWEFVLVDNASRERLADEWDIAWHPRGRHIREDEIGLTPARLRGIREVTGELLVFVDDDNVLDADYLERSALLLRRYPWLGAFGSGALEPEFEVPPPPSLIPRLSLLALRSVSTPLWSNHTHDYHCIPWGAGLCVSRQVAAEYQRVIGKLNMSKVLDRRGQQLTSGGDDLFSWAAARIGNGFGIFPELRVTHLISAARLNEAYFLRLIHDSAFSHSVLGYLLTGSNPKAITLFQYIHLLLHGVRNGRFSMGCQWAGSQGQARAARYITENRLRPIDRAEGALAGSFAQACASVLQSTNSLKL